MTLRRPRVWRGKPPQGGDKGGYVNPSNLNQSAHPDLAHPPPVGPHWDYTDRAKSNPGWRVYPAEKIEKKNREWEMCFANKILDPNMACEYLLSTLEQVEAADSELLQRLHSGSVYALIPEALPEQQAYDFKHGGVIQANCSEGANDTPVQRVVSTANALARELILLKGKDILIHDPLKELSEVSKDDGDVIAIQGAHFYSDKQFFSSLEECERIIQRNTLSWHFLLLAGSWGNAENTSFKKIAMSATDIVVGAYDGESYLVWRANALETAGPANEKK